MRKSLLLCVCVLTGFFAFSNQRPDGHDLRMVKDTTDPENRAANREARKAMLFSAVLPGLGQAYNHRYWKIPVIYVAAGGFSYLAVQNNKELKKYSNALLLRYDGDPNTNDTYDKYSDAQLVTFKKQYKRRRDLAFIGVGATYLFNVIDANVDAHLRKFDEKINEKLSLSVRPTSNVMTTFGQPVYYTGIKLKLHF